MLNFEHEVDRSVLERNIRFFLFDDYFHDSVLDQIEWDVRSRELRLTLWCARESGSDHAPSIAKRDDDLCGLRRIGVPWPSRRALRGARFPSSRTYANYVYELEFLGCEHCTLVGEDDFIEYLNGTFKGSALLMRLQQHSRRRLIHFRMQFTGGFADVVFHRFGIQRAVGRFRLPRMARSQSSWLEETFGSMSLLKVRRLARLGDELLRSGAIWYLFLCQDASALRLAIHATEDGLNSEYLPYDEPVINGIAVIGQLGRREHLDLLHRAYLVDDTPIFRRHVLDAIDHIVMRSTEGKQEDGD